MAGHSGQTPESAHGIFHPTPEPLETHTVHGRKARFHPGCQEGFREDRKHGLIYPPYDVDGQIMSVEAASIAADFCAYCG